MQVIVDRIEKEKIVVEIAEGQIAYIDQKLLPDVQEGDVIDLTINKEATKKRKNKIDKLVDELFQ